MPRPQGVPPYPAAERDGPQPARDPAGAASHAISDEVGKGTGQGLAIAYSVIVKKHAGTLRFETECGKGTTFFIRLPVGERIAERGIEQDAA